MKTYVDYNHDGQPMHVKLAKADAEARGLKRAKAPRNKQVKPQNKAAEPASEPNGEDSGEQ